LEHKVKLEKLQVLTKELQKENERMKKLIIKEYHKEKKKDK